MAKPIKSTTCNIAGQRIQRVHSTTKIVMPKRGGNTALLLQPGYGVNQWGTTKKTKR